MILLMGFFLTRRYVIWVMAIFTIPSCYGYSYDSQLLTTFFHDQASKTIDKPQTGTLYKISLPSNFSGIEATFVRLRSGSFRHRGANFSSIYFPPNVVPIPFVKRLAIVYENLGNWSSLYYKVPNYSLVAPVIGFTVYDSPTLLSDKKLNLSVKEKPISIRFDTIERRQGENNRFLRCVRFGDDGRFEIKNMTGSNGCVADGQGHFSVVVSVESLSPPSLRVKSKRYLRWWLIGFGGGFVGVVLLVVATMAAVRVVKKKRLRAMETRAENGVSFDTFWVGRSRMPSASMVRTQPVIENEYAL